LPIADFEFIGVALDLEDPGLQLTSKTIKPLKPAEIGNRQLAIGNI